MQLLYADITKADARIAAGFASTDTMDGQPGVMDGTPYIGDVVDQGAITGALADYMEYANVREMHQNSAVGTAIKAEVKDGRLWLAVKVVDDGAWNKVKSGVYKGFSIGGRVLKAVLEKLPDGRYIRRILQLALTEISLVDRPANPDAKILLFKMEASMPGELEEGTTPVALDAATIAAIKQLAGQTPLQKAASDPAKIVAQIQALRNEAEVAGDMEGAQMFTQAITLIMQASGEAEAPATEEITETPDEAVAEGADPAGVAMGVATGNLKKAGVRLRMTKRLGGVEALAKSLLQLAADMGSTWAVKLIKAAGAEPSDVSMAQAIGAEFTKAIQPVAGGLLNINERLMILEAQPAAGGPIIRSAPKQIAGQSVAKSVAKPVASGYIREAMDDLLRKGKTDPNPALRAQYMTQYTDLRAQYAE